MALDRSRHYACRGQASPPVCLRQKSSRGGPSAPPPGVGVPSFQCCASGPLSLFSPLSCQTQRLQDARNPLPRAEGAQMNVVRGQPADCRPEALLRGRPAEHGTWGVQPRPPRFPGAGPQRRPCSGGSGWGVEQRKGEPVGEATPPRRWGCGFSSTDARQPPCLCLSLGLLPPSRPHTPAPGHSARAAASSPPAPP